MVLADWSLGVDTVIVFPEVDEPSMNISRIAEVTSVYSLRVFIFIEIILLFLIFCSHGWNVFVKYLVQQSLFIARSIIQKIIECINSVQLALWLRSLFTTMVRITFCTISAGLLLSGLYLSAYEDAKASVLVFSGVASTLFTTKYIFSDIEEINKAVLFCVKSIAYVMFLGFYCPIFTEYWATGVYSVFLGKFLLEMMYDIENSAVENSMARRLSESMFKISGPFNEVQETIKASIGDLQGMSSDTENECPNHNQRLENVGVENSMARLLSGSMFQRSGPFNEVQETIKASIGDLRGMPSDTENECPNRNQRLENVAAENSMTRLLSGSMFQRSGPFNEETIKASIKDLQDMPFDKEHECPNHNERLENEDGAVNEIDLSFIYAISSHA